MGQFMQRIFWHRKMYITLLFFVKPLSICANEEQSPSSMVNVHIHEDEKKL
jgi:hypothetical protein